MPKINFDKNEWIDGEHIIIETKDDLEKLLESGYEADGTSYSLVNGEMTITLRLKYDSRVFLANVSSISSHIMSCLYLYDFKKKKLVLTWVPDTAPHSELEQTQINMIIGRHVRPLLTEKIDSVHCTSIFNSLSEWVKNEKDRRYGIKNVREIFYLVCIVNEKNGVITRKSYNKETMNLDEISTLSSEATNYDQSIALSFFYLTRKLSGPNDTDDVLVGMILYDLKKKKPLCFNIQSSVRFATDRVRDQNAGVFNIVLDLFESSISPQMECKSFVPLPLDSPWYTALPWIVFSVLSGKSLQYNSMIDMSRKITIPEFFIFGYSITPDEGNSFAYLPFSATRHGHATCILNFNDSKQLRYNMRFDQSDGEPLVHLDFAFNDAKEVKIITHNALNLESVYTFNQDLFVAIMSAGLFDSYFTSIIEKGLQGVTELLYKNPVFKYPLKWIWIIDTAIVWLNQNPEGYVILDKLSKNQQLNTQETDLVKNMFENHLTLVAEDRDCNLTGLSYLGSMVLHRFKQGQTQSPVFANSF